jgi:ribonuclease HI
VNQVLALPAPNDADGPDSIGWGGTNTHRFTIQSAYRLQHGDIHAPEGNWKSLWDWKGPHRIQTFIWLAAQERILTNFRRSKWGVGISPLCTRCGRDDETTIHVLRDCVYATQVWLRLVPSNFMTDFFTFDCRNWIFDNISKQGIGGHSTNWKTTFMTTCWFMWTWRNKAIFEENFQQPNNPVLVIQNFVQKIDLCSNQQLHRNFPMKETIYIGWKKPPEGWIKLNSDGACKGIGEYSGCGGLFRDTEGRWLKGYIRKIGVCDALHAEMWGMYLGLEMAWREKIPQLIVESDSKILIDMVTENCKFSGSVPILVQRIRKLLALDWQVRFRHTWREGNRCADWLANFSFSLDSFNCIIMENPSSELRRLLFDDISGASMPRNVRIAS